MPRMATDLKDHPDIREEVGPEKETEQRDLGNGNKDQLEDRLAVSRVCPQCGWSDTRLSFTRTTMDSLLRVVNLRAFRCRTCGKRFRAFHRQ